MICLNGTAELHNFGFVEVVKKAGFNKLDVFGKCIKGRYCSSHIFFIYFCRQIHFNVNSCDFLVHDIIFRFCFNFFSKIISLFQKQFQSETNRLILKTFLRTRFKALSHLIKLFRSRLSSCSGSILYFQLTQTVSASKSVTSIQPQVCMNTLYPVFIFANESKLQILKQISKDRYFPIL